MLPELHISAFSIGIVTIDVLFVLFISYLMMLRRKSAATWYLIGFFACVASVFFAFLFIYATVAPGPARIAWWLLHIMVFGSVCLIQFAYHFPENRNPREARIVLIISVILSVYGWAAYLYRTHDILPVFVFEAYSYNYFGIVEPGAIIGTQMLWAIFVLFRQSAALSGIAARPAQSRFRFYNYVKDFVRRIARAENRYAQACRNFALIFIAPSLLVLSIPLAYLGYLSWELMAYLYTTGVMVGFVMVYITYVNHTALPTTFTFKVVGISLTMFLTVLSLLGNLGVVDAQQNYDRSRFLETEIIRLRIEDLRERDVPAAVAYVAVHAPGNRPPEILYKREDAKPPPFRPMDEAQLRQRFYRKGKDANPDSFYVAYTFPHAKTMYEVGYKYAHYRRALHASAATMTIGILASAVLVFFLLPLFFQASLITPLRSLLGGVRRVNDGDLTVHVPVGAEDEIGYLSRSFNSMVDSVRRAGEIKDEFLANTSHELRTPLHGIIGITESLVDGAAGTVNAEQARNLAMVTASAKRLANLVNDILDFSRLKSSEINLRSGPVDMCQVTEIVLAISAPLLAGKKIEFLNLVPPDLAPLHGDENRLQQVMHNLIGNAAKFTEEGSVRVTAQGQGDMARITVTDTGIGIPADRLADIFRPFEQGDAQVERRYGGTGIGLSITRQLVELHGGTISVESKEGEGTSVHFTIPFSAEENPSEIASSDLERIAPLVDDDIAEQIAPQLAPSLSTPPEHEPVSGEPGENPRVLIVDDEPLNLQVLYNILRLQDYEIISAGDGEEALRLLEQGPRPDLILLDVMMPRLSGYEVCKRVRRRYSPIELPIILITARNQVADLVEGFNSGANDYLTKPVIQRELLARMETHMQLSRISEEHLESQSRAADERRRVIGEVHDNIGSRIGAALMQVGEAEEGLALRATLQSALRNARDLASILNMNARPDSSWEADIRALAGSYEGILGFNMSVKFDPALNRCDLRTQLLVTRILQEWISNSMRHGKARNFSLECRADPRRVVVRLLSDGRPFAWMDRDSAPGTAINVGGGVGLHSISERISSMGGRGRSFRVTETEVGPEGTLLVLRLPRNEI